jgi:hypothetical protein
MMESASLPRKSMILWQGSINAVPVGWALCDGSTVNGVVTPDVRNKYAKGASATSTAHGTVGGASTHSHTATHAHSSSSSATSNASAAAPGQLAIAPVHAHTLSTENPGTDAPTHEPSNVSVNWIIFVGYGSSAAAYASAKIPASELHSSCLPMRGMIIGWWETSNPTTPPTGWQHADGAAWTNGTPSGHAATRPDMRNKMLRGTVNESTNAGTTGGSATHSHTGGDHGHGFASNWCDTALKAAANQSPADVAAYCHNHASVVSGNFSTDTVSSYPPFIEIGFIVRD